MVFKASGNNFKNLFTVARVYKIPDYQREFSWDKENYQIFLKDMFSQLRVESDLSGSVVIDTQPYYMGNMIFWGGDSDPEVDVVDGQQRLTVATILLAVLRDLFTEVATSVSRAEQYANTIQLEYLAKSVDGDYVRKLQTESSYPYFTKTIQDNDGDKIDNPNTEEEKELNACYDYFKDSLSQDNIKKNYLDYFSDDSKSDEEIYVTFLKAIRDQLLASEIVEIFVTDKAQANKIFESINSKGKPLSQVDLIKNDIFSKVFSRTSLTNDGPETWQKLQDVITNNDGSVNEFFLNYWKAMYPEDNVSGKNLYKRYLVRFGNLNERSAFIALLDDLVNSAELYYRITKPSKDFFARQEKKPQLVGLDAINKFGIKQIKSLLLTLYTKKESTKIKNARLNKMILKISDYQFAFFGTNSGVRSNKFTAPYKDASKKIIAAKNQGEVFKALEELIAKFEHELDKQKFIEEFSEITFKKNEARSGMGSFPASYAIHRISSAMNVGCDLNEDSITIEHIIDEKYSGEEISKIGNISILEKNIHDEINDNSVDTFKDKKTYYSRSNSKMIEDLLKKYPDFASDDIDKRGKELGNYFYDEFLV
ncbi:DUF262 domain-containing protein [Weissella viridescens]|uniref:DUF262 domain-containing protein n=1 Tax=Weissella viridescens TaxID=1629 RepID=UPI0040569F7E